ncbi:MAG TPA: 50S ribosomal protein L20 [Candidatus Portnoybacteria bacterium]|nr:50S ribosomal protein L20 [Candidatus Portnoybacteria bacterium]
MTRVKRSVQAKKKRRKVFEQTKGFKWGRKNRYKLAKDALRHALMHAYVDRRRKKRDFRRLWQVQLNAAVREEGLTYSRFINGLKRAKIEINRKVLSELAQHEPEIFKKIFQEAKKEVETATN